MFITFCYYNCNILIKKGEIMKLKKILSVFLSVLMLTMTFSGAFHAFAYMTRDSYEQLEKKFQDGKAIFDYCYFSPEKDEKDDTKYPLVVFLHGNQSGDYPRQQLKRSQAAFWACDDAQAQFHNGGAYIFLPRHKAFGYTMGTLAWDGQTEKLKNCIDQFIAENEKNIDKNRIYVGGYSMGGKAALKQVSYYPNFYAAAFLMSPVHTPVAEEFQAAANTPIWLFSVKNDTKPTLEYDKVEASWKSLCEQTKVPDKIRHTVFDDSYNMDGTIRTDDNMHHNTWHAVVSDLCKFGTEETFDGMHTVDGNGNNVEITYNNSFLAWLNSQALSEGRPSSKPAISIFDRILSFIHRIIDFFNNLFK